MAEDWKAGNYTLLDDRLSRFNEKSRRDEIFTKGDKVTLDGEDAWRLGNAGSIAKTDSPLSKQARGELQDIPFTPNETKDEIQAKLDVLKARLGELGDSEQASSASSEDSSEDSSESAPKKRGRPAATSG